MPSLTYDVVPSSDAAKFNLIPPQGPRIDPGLPELWLYIGHHPQQQQALQPG